MKCFRILIFITFVVVFSNEIFAQKEIKAVFPIDGTTNVNVGILKWSAQEGVKYDLYFGTSSNPGLFKSDLDAMEVKPVILELNKKYYWKIVEKKTDKAIRSSKIFSFSTLPIVLNPKSEYKSFVDIRDYKVYWTISVNGNDMKKEYYTPKIISMFNLMKQVIAKKTIVDTNFYKQNYSMNAIGKLLYNEDQFK